MNLWMPMFLPMIPTNNMKPPTVYAILNSICNFDAETQTKIVDLAKVGRTKIFNFDYPLSEKVDKEKFECMILNHFLQRRINFQTITGFQIQLNVKLNEIMPLYNKMFDSLDDWNIFEDGEKTTHDSTDDRSINVETDNTRNNNTKIISNNSLESNSTTTSDITSDLRYSKMPQNELQNIKDGKYVTDYNYNQDNATNTDNSNSSGNSNSTSESNDINNINTNTKDNNILHEEWNKSPADKIAIYKEFQENIKSIYGMIFKDLECLFYGLE